MKPASYFLTAILVIPVAFTFAGQADDYRAAILSFDPVVYYTCNAITDGIVENLIHGEPNGLCYNNPDVSAAGIFHSEPAPSGVQFTGSSMIRTMIDVSEQELAVGFWFKATATTCGLFGIYQGSYSYDRGLYLSSGNICAYLYNTQTISSSGRNYADGAWHQVIYTYGASIGGQVIYVDGNPVASGNKTSSDFDWQDEIRFGQSNTGGYLAGTMDEMFVINRALTAAEVESLYDPFVGTYILSVSPIGIVDITADPWDGVILEFSDQLSTFPSAAVELVAGDAPVAVTSVSCVLGTTWRIDFAPQAVPARYRLTIDGSQILDLRGEPLDINKNAVLGEAADTFFAAFMTTDSVSLYDGIVGLWTLDEGSGPLASDCSTQQNHGRLNGPVWTEGVANAALSFDGNDNVNCGGDASLTMTDQLTLAAWIKPSTNHHGVIAGNEGQYHLAVESDGTVIYALNMSSPPWTWSRTECTIQANVWTHLALSVSAAEGVLRLYKNGLLVYERSCSGVIGDYHPEYPDFMIGSRQGYPNESFRGVIDEVTLFDRPLSEGEVRTLMAKAASAVPDLLYKTDDETSYAGDDVYVPTPQVLTQQVAANLTDVFDVELQNDSGTPALIMLSGPASSEAWDVDYLDAATGTSLYDEITGDGKLYSLATGAGNLTVLITPKTAGDGDTFDCVLTASQLYAADHLDRITLRAAFSSKLPAPPYGRLFTSCEDFSRGRSHGVTCETAGDDGHLRLSEVASTLPFLWVPNSSDGTISKVNSVTGDELARYRVGPSSSDPSRTTVDLYGNCWVANRNAGTVVKVGLYENGQYLDRNLNGKIDTSTDLDGDGTISGAEILPFGADECVLLEVVIITGREGAYAPGTYTGGYMGDGNCGPRGIAIDAHNNCWVGTRYSQQYYYIDGATGQVLEHYDFRGLNHRPYGAVIDENGTLWSAGEFTNTLLWLDPATGEYDLLSLGHCVYGLGIDGNGHLFVSGWEHSRLTRVDVNSKTVDWSVPGKFQSRGVAITNDGNVWVANSGENSVSRWTNDGEWIADIVVGSYPTGVSVDADGFVWAVNYNDQMINRIDPATNTIVVSKLIAGYHYGYSDMTGIVSRSATTKIGTWTASINSGLFDAPWGAVKWNDSTPWGTDIDMYIRTSNNRLRWSQWEYVDIDKPLRFTPPGRYAELQASFRSIVDDVSPVLYDISVYPSPACGDADHVLLDADINKDCRVNILDLAVLADKWLMQ